MEKKNGRILLSGTCAELAERRNGLAEWSQRRDSASPAADATVHTVAEQRCQADMTGLLPPFLAAYHGLRFQLDWGNCWGAALAAAGLIPHPLQTRGEADDIADYLSPPACREVEEPRAGDIGAVRMRLGEGDFREIHGFVYLGDGLVFSKNSYSRMDPFLIQPARRMFARYPVEERCRGKLREGCRSYLLYYRCRPAAELAAMASAEARAALQKQEAILSKAECQEIRIAEQGRRNLREEEMEEALERMTGLRPGFFSGLMGGLLKQANREAGAAERKLKTMAEGPAKDQLLAERYLWKVHANRIMALMNWY